MDNIQKNTNFSEWYTQVITKSEMLEYYDISGCYILRPWSYKIWELIQKFLDEKISEMGVENAYFPMFVSQQKLEVEKEHIEGFAPEVAWVTKSGNKNLSEQIAIRPTSETIMYPSFSKWIKSHRDLPLKINQWSNVVRWEFKHPQPFIRTREFLWQEGHTVHALKEEAEKEVLEVLDLYKSVYEDLLAIPTISGRKSENEKFAGGLYTTTIECFIPITCRGIQAATSHCLGQKFAKIFDISYEDSQGEKSLPWQNSWGLTTRSIGIMVMVHGDNKGLVLPPKVAPIQVIIVPCGINSKTTEEDKKRVYNKIESVVKTLKANNVRAQSDLRENYSAGWKFNHWELKGVPVRIEIGPKELNNWELKGVPIQIEISLEELDKDEYNMYLRYSNKRKKAKISQIHELLDEIHQEMFEKAKRERDNHIKIIKNSEDFNNEIVQENMILVPWCEQQKCEEDLKQKFSSVKSLCIPFDQPEECTNYKCLFCTSSGSKFALFGRSY